MGRKSVFLLIGILLIALIVGAAFFRSTTLERRIGASLKGGPDIQFEPPYTPEFLEGIRFPSEILALSQNHKREVLTGKDLVRRFEELDYPDTELVIKRARSILGKVGSSTPAAWIVPPVIDITAPHPDLKRLRDFSRIQALIGRYLIAAGRPGEGVDVLLSAAHSGAMACFEHPERVTLIVSMIARAMIGIAAEGFILAARDLSPDRGRAKEIREALVHAGGLLPPLSYSYGLERKFIGSLSAAYRKLASSTHSAEALARADAYDEVAIKAEPHLAKLMDPWIPFEDLPWSQGWPKLTVVPRNNEEYMADHFSLSGPGGLLRKLVDPYDSVAGVMLSISVPIPTGAFKAAWQANQKIEGASTVLALEAFRREKGALPRSLQELGTWLGNPLGEDFFTGKALSYDHRGPSLWSIGPDLATGTVDDVWLLPLEKLVK